MTKPPDRGTGETATAVAAMRLPNPAESAPVSDPGDALEPGQRLERFVVIGRLGKGAMGVVYEAFDCTLDRRVALKLMDAGRRDDDAAVARFMREARALAQLSHPNVVQVHDIGSVGPASFIAMELVKGETLAGWLESGKRSVRETIAVLIAAGNGLAAAHHAGIVHRDVKPTNLIIGTDGRVRVIDFGVARHEAARGGDDSGPSDPGADAAPTSLPIRAADSALTEAGALVGTPAFMAPEQLAGGVIDARTDQFAFAVTAFRALYGVKPFEGRTREARLAAIAKGPLEPPRDAPRVPGHVHRALLRALAPAPELRYPSIDALLADLRRDPATIRRRLAGAVGALAIGVVGFLLLRGGSTPEPCATATRALDEIWNPARRAALVRAFAETGREDAARLHERTVAGLDRFAAPWSAMRVETCRATHVDHTQSEEVLDARMRCLDEHLAPMRELLAIYTDAPSSDAVGGSVDAVLALPSVASCADVRSLLARTPLPVDPHARVEIASAQIVVERARALRYAGRSDDALALLEGTLPSIRALDYPPLLADAVYQMAAIEDALGHDAAAMKLAWEALPAAARAGDPGFEVTVSSGLIWTLGVQQERFAEAEILALTTRAALARGGDPPLPRSQLLHNIAQVHFMRGELARAREELVEALALREHELGKVNLKVAQTLGNLAWVEVAMDRADDGIARAQRARAIYEELYGADHPEVAMALTGIMRGHLLRGELAPAKAAANRAIEILERTVGTAHPRTAMTYIGRAEIEAEAGELAEARADLARATTGLGEVEASYRGGGTFQRVLAVIERRAGHHDKARAALRIALERAEHAGPETPPVIEVLLERGRLEVVAGNFDDAVTAVERALAIATNHETPPRQLAQLRFTLASALRDPERARDEATAARALAATVRRDPARQHLLAEIDGWLSGAPAGGRSSGVRPTSAP